MQEIYVDDIGTGNPIELAQGILAGVAILFVALNLDRVVQGKKRD